MISPIKISDNPAPDEWKNLLTRPARKAESLDETVRTILAEVKLNGDEAVAKYSLQFEGVNIQDRRVSSSELEIAAEKINPDLKNAILQAKQNISKFHENQVRDEGVVEISPGIQCWRKTVGIEKVGLYIPGGTAPLFSTLLMLGIPAVLAGCREIVVCSPPQKDGTMHPAILFTAKLLGIRKIFKVGGVQAIAAMAYGTESIPAVYKIFGPGNQYVTKAKQLVQQEGVAIDMPAGPSELAIYADETADPRFIAADLLSQCEHGTDSQVILVTNSKRIADEVDKELYSQLETLPRKNVAGESLRNSRIFCLTSTEDSLALINEYAPEHLILACENAETISNQISNSGSVFIGNYAPESAGDYASGTNHTLPTNGYAKMYSGVSMDSFVKKISFQKLTKEGLNSIGKSITDMARTEGLEAHANAVEIRFK